jgi:hypothetical protein
MIGTNSVIIAPNIDTQLSKITAIRTRSTFVAHPLYTRVQFRANGSHTIKTADHLWDHSQDWGRLPIIRTSALPSCLASTAIGAAAVLRSDSCCHYLYTTSCATWQVASISISLEPSPHF